MTRRLIKKYTRKNKNRNRPTLDGTVKRYHYRGGANQPPAPATTEPVATEPVATEPLQLTPMNEPLVVDPETPQMEPEMESETPQMEPETPQMEPETEPETPQTEPEMEPETPQMEPETEPETPQMETETPQTEPETPQMEQEESLGVDRILEDVEIMNDIKMLVRKIAKYVSSSTQPLQTDDTAMNTMVKTLVNANSERP